MMNNYLSNKNSSLDALGTLGTNRYNGNKANKPSYDIMCLRTALGMKYTSRRKKYLMPSSSLSTPTEYLGPVGKITLTPRRPANVPRLDLSRVHEDKALMIENHKALVAPRGVDEKLSEHDKNRNRSFISRLKGVNEAITQIVQCCRSKPIIRKASPIKVSYPKIPKAISSPSSLREENRRVRKTHKNIIRRNPHRVNTVTRQDANFNGMSRPVVVRHTRLSEKAQSISGKELERRHRSGPRRYRGGTSEIKKEPSIDDAESPYRAICGRSSPSGFLTSLTFKDDVDLSSSIQHHSSPSSHIHQGVDDNNGLNFFNLELKEHRFEGGVVLYNENESEVDPEDIIDCDVRGLTPLITPRQRSACSRPPSKHTSPRGRDESKPPSRNTSPKRRCGSKAASRNTSPRMRNDNRLASRDTSPKREMIRNESFHHNGIDVKVNRKNEFNLQERLRNYQVINNLRLNQKRVNSAIERPSCLLKSSERNRMYDEVAQWKLNTDQLKSDCQKIVIKSNEIMSNNNQNRSIEGNNRDKDVVYQAALDRSRLNGCLAAFSVVSKLLQQYELKEQEIRQSSQLITNINEGNALLKIPHNIDSDDDTDNMDQQNRDRSFNDICSSVKLREKQLESYLNMWIRFRHINSIQQTKLVH